MFLSFPVPCNGFEQVLTWPLSGQHQCPAYRRSKDELASAEVASTSSTQTRPEGAISSHPMPRRPNLRQRKARRCLLLTQPQAQAGILLCVLQAHGAQVRELGPRPGVQSSGCVQTHTDLSVQRSWGLRVWTNTLRSPASSPPHCPCLSGF